MARDKWGYGPTYFGKLGKSRQEICSLTIPQECYQEILRLVKEKVKRVYVHLPDKSNATRKLRVYSHFGYLADVTRHLRENNVPYDLVDENGNFWAYRCTPTGQYNSYFESFEELNELLPWNEQWKLRSLLKTLQLINPEAEQNALYN